MRTYKESLKMFKYNFPSVILFEITFRLLSAAVLLPLIYTVFNLAVELAEINYLTKDTLKIFLKEPSTYGFAFLILLMLSAYVLINISGLIYAMEASHREDKITSVEILFKGIGNALRVMNPRNFGVMVYVLFILPFTYSILISGSLVTSSVPEFIINFITQNKIIIAIAIVVYLLVCIFSMSRIFSLNYYTLYSVNYKEAVRLSKKTIKSSFVK
ncbi:MAG: glycerophosphoryl diester phosphodiesterase membrane domain-containing protein, partial [Lachnospiraceae bacterium]|nr:glycerophosphoryl diester phosphodiesterase membrane domain-containing protein [Lachnospiraceae bacterium]